MAGVAERAGDEDRRHRARPLRLLPGNHPDDRRRHQDVENGDDDDRQHDRPGNRPGRIPDLVTDVAHLVVAAVAVHRQHRGGAQAGEHLAVESVGVGGEVERLRERRREESGDNDPADGSEDDDQHDDGQPADGLDVAVKQRRHGDADAGSEQVVPGRRHRRPEELQIVREADGAAGDRQRRDEDGLEDEHEGHQPAEPERLEGLAQIEVRAAAAGQRGAELGVDQPVAQRQQRPHHPRVDDVRAVHRRDHERDGQERSDADHADDVGGGGLEQAHSALERRRTGSGRWHVCRVAHAISFETMAAAVRSSATSGFSASAATASRADCDRPAATVARS